MAGNSSTSFFCFFKKCYLKNICQILMCYSAILHDDLPDLVDISDDQEMKVCGLFYKYYIYRALQRARCFSSGPLTCSAEYPS